MRLPLEWVGLLRRALPGVILTGSVVVYTALILVASQPGVLHQTAEPKGNVLIMAQGQEILDESDALEAQQPLALPDETATGEPEVIEPVTEIVRSEVAEPQENRTETPVAVKEPERVQVETTLSAQAEVKTVEPVPAEPAPSVQTVSVESEQLLSRGTESNGTKIVDLAMSLLGASYVSGGMSRNGFDCSGLAKYVYSGVGITIPRTSYDQFAGGTAVSKADLEPGDLVFFTTYASGASHTGIYIGGNQFIHASNPQDGVKITSLSDSYYAARYLGAKRY
ncbi:MAG: C40 family peptidase [Peptococcaceae bacterium]|nr:C40 family peptidase [Peptococcaceae bacterium]